MIVIEYKIKAKQHQYRAIDEAIRTGQFVRNKALRYWMDNKGVNKYDLNKYCRIIAKEYDFANKLNSTARQSSAERAWSSIARFFDNCKKSPRAKRTPLDKGGRVGLFHSGLRQRGSRGSRGSRGRFSTNTRYFNYIYHHGSTYLSEFSLISRLVIRKIIRVY